MSINKVIKYFGSQSELARILGITRGSVNRWFINNQIPAKRQLQIQHMTKGKFKAEL